MRILKSHPLLRLVNSYIIDASEPSNISYLWNFGSLLAVCLIVQIITGVTLAMHLKLFWIYLDILKKLYNPLLPEIEDDVEEWIKNFKSF